MRSAASAKSLREHVSSLVSSDQCGHPRRFGMNIMPDGTRYDEQCGVVPGGVGIRMCMPGACRCRSFDLSESRDRFRTGLGERSSRSRRRTAYPVGFADQLA